MPREGEANRALRTEDRTMSKPNIAQKGPYAIELERGKKYAWCACGRSANQPLCDGSHKGTGLSPNVFTADETKTAHLCGCKHTNDAPFCDGTHQSLD
jgi:CDGSH-type Zn-finger protein